jgi:calmodulin
MAKEKKFEQMMKDAKKMKKLMEDAFRKVDIDGSGFLERGEFEQVLVQIAKEIGVDNPTREEVDEILDEIDENGDNRISRKEFSDLIEKVFQMISLDDAA